MPNFLIGMLVFALLAAYVGWLRPWRSLQRHLGTLTDKRASYQPPRGWGPWRKAHAQLSELGTQLDQYASHSRAELEVITAEANRLSTVLNAISDGVVALDEQAHVLLFNHASERITGFSLEEAAGRPVSQVLPLMRGQGLLINDWLATVAGSDIQSARWENVRLQTKLGKTKAVDVDALYHGADPYGIRTLITFHDRTEAQEVEDMKVDFVALAAHELRTPITVIRGYLEILESELATQLSPEHKDFLNKLNVSAAQLSSLINNILHVSRIEHGDLSLRLEATDWGAFIREACLELAPKAKAQGKQILIEIPPKLPPVAVDRMSIVEVINNLVDNALKYGAPASNVVVAVAQTADGVETQVRDRGEGIPENVLDKLFTKFYRASRTKLSHRGTGLGLYMSKSIVEAHGGKIWVRSQVGEGSVFGFNLPVYDKLNKKHMPVTSNNKIIRGVHGWIKNHSLYRG